MHAYANVIAHGDPICSTYNYITQKYKDRQNAIIAGEESEKKIKPLEWGTSSCYPQREIGNRASTRDRSSSQGKIEAVGIDNES